LILIVSSCGRSRALAEEGLKRLDQRKYTSALELFDRALRSDPNEALALYGKGTLLAEEQITEQIALSMLNQSVQQTSLARTLPHQSIFAHCRDSRAARSERGRDCRISLEFQEHKNSPMECMRGASRPST
jgi:tetratricopeptide (TPR) repeat protein